MDYTTLRKIHSINRKESLEIVKNNEFSKEEELKKQFEIFWINNSEKFFQQIVNDYKSGKICSEIKIDSAVDAHFSLIEFKNNGYDCELLLTSNPIFSPNIIFIKFDN